MKFASIHPEVMVSLGIAKRIDGDDRSPAGIPDDVCQELSQYPRAACSLGSDKADAMILCLFSEKKKEILLRTDYRRPAGIPNNVRQKLSQNSRAVCRLGGDKADAIGACLKCVIHPR
mgnify:CR=1 FL=1